MSKFIKVIKFYDGYPSDKICIKDVYLNLDNIESFEAITFDRYGSHFSYYFKKREGKSDFIKVPISLVETLLISTNGAYYFSKSPIEKFMKFQECESIKDRWEILDL